MHITNEWVESPDHPGYYEKVIKRDNYTVRILRPVLSDKERAKREAHTNSVAAKVLRDYYIRKEANV